MIMKRWHLGGLAAVLLLLSQRADADVPARRITLAEVAKLADAQALEIRIADRGVVAAEERVASTRAQLFPRLRADGSVFVWNEALEVDFAPPGQMGGAAITVRDQVTATLNVTVAQPITGLFALFRLLGIEQSGLGAAEADLERARLDAAHRAVEAFLRVLQVRAVQDIADKSVAQVDAQLERARALEAAGVLGRIDILRLQSARANALQASLRARAGAEIAGRALALTVDLPSSEALDPVDDLPDPPPELTIDVRAAVASAAQRRPEITASARRIEQAEAGRAVALAAMFPNVVAVATYSHNEGSGTFQPANALFVGGTFQWDVWDWGKSWSAADEASARADQARLGAEALADQIAFDAERRVLDARTAFESLGVAKSGLAAAEEAHRLQSVRFAQGDAATTDVLDAETDLARARTSYTSTRYEYYLALLALARATGDAPQIPAPAPR